MQRTKISFTHRLSLPVPEPVSELYVEPQGPEAFHISWRPPVNNPCPIANYVIMYSLVNREQCEEIEPDLDIHDVVTTDQMYILRDLEAYSTYSVNVMAETEAGVGDALTINKNTTNDGISFLLIPIT